MAYHFTIATREELESIQWLAERYDYACQIEKALDTPMNEQWSIDSEHYPVVFRISEHMAWAIQAAVETEDGYLPCLGGRLKNEVETLLNSIV